MSVIIFIMFTSSSEVTVTQGDSTALPVVQLSSRGEEKKNEKNRQIKEQLAVSKTCNNDRTNYFPSLYSSN